MYFDIFNEIKNNLEKPRTLSRPNLLTINPSSQVCYTAEGVQVGSCLRSVWLDKTNQERTNSFGLKGRMSAFSGNWWEDWFVNQLKETHLYEDSQIIASDPSRFMKGFIDVSFKNPLSGKTELIEVKTYDGSNYYGAQSVLGTSTNPPAPKVSHLLQAFRYLMIYEEEIEAINLCYIDRACGDWYKYKQFRITFTTLNGRTYPKIETIWKEEYYSYINKDVSKEGINEAELKLLEHLMENKIPMKEFHETYPNEVIGTRFLDGEIPKYKYDKWLKDPENNPIGDFQCNYCPFSKGTCKNYGD